jgi:ABC-type transport system involved in cytochrome bd biosynthesis fused ATPase/permease subunit
MPVNTYKNKPKIKPLSPNQNTGNRSVFALIEKYIRLDIFFDQGLPVRYIPYILYLTFLGIVYIANRNYAEKTATRITKLKALVNDLRTEYVTESAEYMIAGKQSEVAKKVKEKGLGIEESRTPPTKIVVPKK